jgi:hypothetical protein
VTEDVIDLAKFRKSISFAEMSDDEFYTLEYRFREEKARREYAHDYPKEMSFRRFCARVKCEFMHKLVLSQRQIIEEICNAKPPPTLRECLEDERERMELERGRWRDKYEQFFVYHFFPWLRSHWCLWPSRSRAVNHWALIWRRIRDDWGTIEPGTFEHELERQRPEEVAKAEEAAKARRLAAGFVARHVPTPEEIDANGGVWIEEEEDE